MHESMTPAAIAVAAPVPAAVVPASAATTLRIVMPPASSTTGGNVRLFETEVEAPSQGEIVVEIADPAAAGTDGGLAAAVASGALETAVVPLSCYAGEIPAAAVFSMPFLLTTAEAVRAAVAPDCDVRWQLEAGIGNAGAKVLWWQAHGSVVLLSNGASVAAPKDMEGKPALGLGPCSAAGSMCSAARHRWSTDRRRQPPMGVSMSPSPASRASLRSRCGTS